MSMGIIFELIADIRRWRNDKKVNNYKVQMVYEKAGAITTMDSTAEKLRVGDIIQMSNGYMVPADGIVLSTRDALG